MTRGRKPKIIYEVLEVLCYRKLSSIKGLETLLSKGHVGVFNAVKYLRERKLIEVKLTDENKVRGTNQKGRAEIYYKINKQGLQFLLSARKEPQLFWKCLVGYCYANHESIEYEFVNLLFEDFLKNNMEYSFKFYYPLLDEFNIACNKWTENIARRGNKLTLDQKVLEILALTPRTNLNQLVELTHASKKQIMTTIAKYAPIRHRPFIIGKDDMTSGNFLKGTDWKTKLLKLVQVSNDSKDPVFELTLFGVILILHLMYAYDKKNITKLFYGNISIPQYFEKIAVNYSKKLPFIFGKWNKLTKIFGDVAFLNFDIVVDANFREQVSSKLPFESAYDCIKGISKQCLMTMSYLQSQGLQIIGNELASMNIGLRNDMLRKINPVYEFLIKTTIISHQESYTDDVFAEELKKSNQFHTSESIIRLAGMYALNKLEESFANEITWIYFVNISRDNYIINYQPTRTSLVRNETRFDKEFLLASEKLCILINEDREVKSLISNIIDDIELYKTKSLKEVQVLKSKLVK